MHARVFGGCTALLLTALLACRESSERAGSAPSASAEVEEEAPVEPTSAPAGESALSALAPKAAEPEPATEAAARRVVLVTLDGVRWEDILGTTPETSTLAMPNLHRLVSERGAAFGGADCPFDARTHGSTFVSFPGYLEIFTGKPTACTHNYCPGPDGDTFVDQVRKASPRASDVAVFASWNRYGAAATRDKKSIVLSSGAHSIALPVAKEDAKLKALLDFGSAKAGYPGWGDYRQDVHTARIALRYLETKAPRLLVIGLGDADEQAHRADITGYRRAIARSDEILGDLERTLARMGPEGERTAVLVTTDHGRARSLVTHGAAAPESGRVFFAGWGAGVARRGVTCAAEVLELTHVAGAVRSLLGVESDEAAGPLAEELTSDPASRSVR